jgi:hypothetical protein
MNRSHVAHVDDVARCRSPLEGITEADHSNDALLANQLESTRQEPRFTVSGNGIEKNEPAKLNGCQYRCIKDVGEYRVRAGV